MAAPEPKKFTPPSRDTKQGKRDQKLPGGGFASACQNNTNNGSMMAGGDNVDALSKNAIVQLLGQIHDDMLASATQERDSNIVIVKKKDCKDAEDDLVERAVWAQFMHKILPAGIRKLHLHLPLFAKNASLSPIAGCKGVDPAKLAQLEEFKLTQCCEEPTYPLSRPILHFPLKGK